MPNVLQADPESISVIPIPRIPSLASSLPLSLRNRHFNLSLPGRLLYVQAAEFKPLATTSRPCYLLSRLV